MNGKTTFKNGKTTLSSWCSWWKALSSGFTGTIVPVAVVACFINFIFGPGTAILHFGCPHSPASTFNY